MKKRILAIMLACFMIVSLLPMNVFAAEDKCPQVGEGTHTAENCNCEVVKVVEPTCNGWGYTVYRCVDCDELFADDITEKKGEHVMETIEAVEPVCDPDPEKMTNGVVGGEICSVCGWFDAELYPVKPGTEIVAEHDFVAEEGATCLTGTTFNCTKCEATYTTEAGEHVWSEHPVHVFDPNEHALEDGWAIYQCTLCGEYSEKIVVLHHECEKHAVVVPGKAPTCTETGLKDSWKCTICDRQFTTGVVVVEDVEQIVTILVESEEDLLIPALGHKDEDYVVFEEIFELPEIDRNNSETWFSWVVPYDCEITFSNAEGTGHLVIYVNGQWTVNLNNREGRTSTMELTAGDVVAFKNYKPADLDVTYVVESSLLYADATCQDVYSRQYTCARCGELIVEEEQSGPHNYKILYSKDATCTENGYVLIGCVTAGCDYHEPVMIPATGHTEAEEAVEIVAATCTKVGTNGYFCETCGTLLRTETVEALGHDYVGVVTTPGTCVTKEVTTYTCSRCGDSYEVVGTTNDQHNPEDMNKGIVNEPTCTEDGNRIFFCTWCNERVAQTLPATGHVHTYTVTYFDCGNGSVGSKPYYEVTIYCDDCDTKIFYEIQPVEREYLVIYEGGTHAENLDAAAHDHWWGSTVDYNEAMEELGYVDGENIHYNTINYVSTLREATCTLDGLHKYQCNWCGEYMIVVEPATGHQQTMIMDLPMGEYYQFPCAVTAFYVDDNLTVTYDDGLVEGLGGTVIVEAVGYVAAVRPTCTTPGATESYTCVFCGELVESEVIPTLGHDFDIEISAREETCAQDGSYAGGHCEVCDKWFKVTVEDEETIYTEIASPDELVIDEFEHTLVVIDQFMPAFYDDGRDLGYMYVHVGCEFCGEEFIVNFHRHHFALNAELSIAPTCTEGGVDVYTCSCGFYYHEPVDALGHRDENGAVLENICANKGKKCAVCEAEITVDHQFGNWEHVDANCQNGEYEIRFCTICGAYEVNPLNEELGDHVWGQPQPIYDENGFDTGKYIVGCLICGHVEIKNANAAVEYTAKVENEILIVGSEMAVTITLSGNTADVWGFDIDVNYDNKTLKFLRAEFGANFEGFANDNETFISVAANADGAAVVTEEVVVTLYFEVVKATDGEITIDHNMTTDPELNKIEAATTGDKYDISLLMDYNNDGVIDLLDVQGVYNYIAGTEGFKYSVLGDVDMDGDMDLDDLVAIYKHIVG